ncbi:MAG: disulfide bond formation protein B [Pseudomonadota bacterium]|nr:disulfide bond formation protein B [Pseudomonadota bacterium]
MRTATPSLMLAALLTAGIGPLAIALGVQYLGGLEPCILCQYQRIPYWIVIALALTGLFVPSVDKRGIFLVAATVFAAAAALAFYHAGVEQNWWGSVAQCDAGPNQTSSFEAFRSTPLKPLAKPCKEVDWTLFGYSITVYNTLVSIALAAAALFAARCFKSGAVRNVR